MSGFMPIASSEKSVSNRSVERRGAGGIPRPAGGAQWVSIPDTRAPPAGGDGRRAGSGSVVARAERRLLDLHQELDVRARLLQLVEQQLQRLLGLQRAE